MDCDAKACYNRVIPTVAALVQVQVGLPLMAAQFFLQALKQFKYHMVTSYSVSDTGVTHTETHPIYGFGQGVIGTPPNWTLISNMFQKAYEKHSKECRILDPIRTIQLKAQGQ
eukprot:1421231-Ditylum_brightwellii.AAC.1